MRNVWFYLMVGVIWVLILFIGVNVYRNWQDKEVVMKSSYYNWEALVEEDFLCVDAVEVDKVISYTDISWFMEEISDGMFEDVVIEKEDDLHITLNMYMQGKYFDKLKKTFPEMEWMFSMVQGLPLQIICNPVLDDGVALNIESAKVGMIDLPLSLFDVLEEEIEDVVVGINPLEVYLYQWQSDGLYLHGLIPLRIERNS